MSIKGGPLVTQKNCSHRTPNKLYICLIFESIQLQLNCFQDTLSISGRKNSSRPPVIRGERPYYHSSAGVRSRAAISLPNLSCIDECCVQIIGLLHLGSISTSDKRGLYIHFLCWCLCVVCLYVTFLLPP